MFASADVTEGMFPMITVDEGKNQIFKFSIFNIDIPMMIQY